jgi:pimeloyl-ACP methyl ester carboxylesterase
LYGWIPTPRHRIRDKQKKRPNRLKKSSCYRIAGSWHTPFSDRKLSRATLASDVEKVMDHLKIDSADIAGYSFGGQIALIGEPFNLGDENIAKITAPVLIISGDNDGMDKVELAKTYKLLGGGVAADMQPMPKSQLAIIPNQSHVSLMMQTKTIFGYLDSFLRD